MKKSYILASVVSLTLAGFAPAAFSQQNNRNNDRNDRYELRQDNRIPYSQVPGEAKRAIEPNLNLNDKVTEAYKYTRGGRTVYVVMTNDERIIRADDKGNLLSVRNVDEPGESSNKKPIKFGDLPGDARKTLRSEASGNPVEIFEVNRDGKTYYVANIEENDGTRRIKLDKNGKMIDKPILLSNRDDRDDIDFRRRQDRARYDRDSEHVQLSELPGRIKSTVMSEIGNDKVTDVLKVNRDGKTLYRVEIEGENRAKTLWIDDQGKLLKELNDTEEGRVRVSMSELPGPVKSGLINEAHGKEPKRIWQVTRGRDTWYIGEAEDGHLVRVDSEGKVISHDSNPNVLNNRRDDAERSRDRDNRDNNRDNNAERNRDNNRNDNVLQRRSDNTPDRKFEKPVDLDRDNDGKIDGVKVEYNDLSADVRRTIKDQVKSGEEVKAIYKTKRESDGTVHYVVETDNGRYIRIGSNGGLLGQSK